MLVILEVGGVYFNQYATAYPTKVTVIPSMLRFSVPSIFSSKL
jgi:hypothetical protein